MYFGLDHFGRYGTKICGIHVKLGVRNFSVVGYVGETSHTFSAQGISIFLLTTGRIQKGTKDSDQSDIQRGFHSEAIREPCATRSSCILR